MFESKSSVSGVIRAGRRASARLRKLRLDAFASLILISELDHAPMMAMRLDGRDDLLEEHDAAGRDGAAIGF